MKSTAKSPGPVSGEAPLKRPDVESNKTVPQPDSMKSKSQNPDQTSGEPPLERLDAEVSEAAPQPDDEIIWAVFWLGSRNISC